jgi:hypothetical protein
VSKLTQCEFAVGTQNKISVSTRLVVKSALGTIASELAFTNVQLGLQALSVSILTNKSSHKVFTLARESLTLLSPTQLQNIGLDTLVFAVTSQIFCSWSAAANVISSSKNKLSHSLIASQAK